MNVFGIGLPEMGLIMIVALLVFGPKKLPEIGTSVAKTIKELKKVSADLGTELKKETDQIEKSINTPMKATLEKPRALAADKPKAEPTEAEIIETSAAEPANVEEDSETKVA